MITILGTWKGHKTLSSKFSLLRLFLRLQFFHFHQAMYELRVRTLSLRLLFSPKCFKLLCKYAFLSLRIGIKEGGARGKPWTFRKRHRLENIATEVFTYISFSLGITWQLNSNILIATFDSYEFIAFYLVLIIYSCTHELFALKILFAFLIGNEKFSLQNSSSVWELPSVNLWPNFMPEREL